MAARRFHVAKPDQLQAIVPLLKQNAPLVARTVRIWKAAKDKYGETRWDSGVYIDFPEGSDQSAVLFRMIEDNETVVYGFLAYNMALRWCEQHLKPAK